MTVIYRPDYAKWLFVLPRGLFHQYYEAFCRESHQVKFSGEFLRNHRVTALPSQNLDYENTVLEVWGEWAGLCERMTGDEWLTSLRRLDIRGTVWDASTDAVLYTGQLIQRADVGYNVEVFNSKPASKRQGRDRGGKGFRIGSRKSDVCVVCYRRTGEPVALEFRVQGTVLRKLYTQVITEMPTPVKWHSRWAYLKQLTQDIGEQRFNRILDRAGIGVYWPTISSDMGERPQQLQRAFYPPAYEEEAGMMSEEEFNRRYPGDAL